MSEESKYNLVKEEIIDYDIYNKFKELSTTEILLLQLIKQNNQILDSLNDLQPFPE